MSTNKKKKKSGGEQQFLSPEKYLKTKVRSLPITKVFWSKNFQQEGIANVIIGREHTNGNFSYGIFLVDIWLLGVKDCFFLFNQPEEDLKKQFEGFDSLFEETTYEKAHNLIYGAVDYALDFGFLPHEDFERLKKILEPDTDDIPIIEFEYGKDGKPTYMVEGTDRDTKVLLKLESQMEPDQFNIIGLDGQGVSSMPDMEDFNPESETLVPDFKSVDEEREYLIALKDLIDEAFAEAFGEEKIIFAQQKYNDEELALEKKIQVIDKIFPGVANSVAEDKLLDELIAQFSEISQSIVLTGNMPEQELEALDKKLAKAIEDYPENPELLLHQINYHLLVRDAAAAKKVHEQAVQKFPEHPFITIQYVLHAFVELSLMDYEEARSIMQKARRLEDWKPAEKGPIYLNTYIQFLNILFTIATETGNISDAEIFSNLAVQAAAQDHFELAAGILYNNICFKAFQVWEGEFADELEKLEFKVQQQMGLSMKSVMD